MALRLFLVRVKYDGGWALVAGKNEQAIFDALGNLDANVGEPDLDSVIEIKSGGYVHFPVAPDGEKAEYEDDDHLPTMSLSNGCALLNGAEQEIAGLYQPTDGTVALQHEGSIFEKMRIEDPRVMALYDPDTYVSPVEARWVADARWATQQNGIGKIQPVGSRICMRRGVHQGPVTLRMDLGIEATKDGWDAFQDAAWKAAQESATLEDFEPTLVEAAGHHLGPALAERLQVKFKANGTARSFYVRGGTMKRGETA